MKKTVLFIMLFTLLSSSAFAAKGVITIKSKHSVKYTVKKLVRVLKKKGMTVFKVVDHTAGARRAGVRPALRPTVLVIFGNPKIGTHLMHCVQTAAIDLPQKALIWQDKKGKTWFSYNDARYMADRHGINMGNRKCAAIVKKITGALAKFARVATR